MDLIEGPVLEVVDGDTFSMTVERVGADNDHEYNDIERVRLYGIDAPELGTRGGDAARGRLHRQLGGRVQVRVRSRDKYGRIIGDVVH